jgi:Fe-S cluster biogenesis protein NfuA
VTATQQFGGEEMRERVEATLEKIRPSLQADGGDVELVGVDGGVVTLRLTGACGSCPMSTLTLRMGVERLLKKDVPEMTQLVAV